MLNKPKLTIVVQAFATKTTGEQLGLNRLQFTSNSDFFPKK